MKIGEQEKELLSLKVGRCFVCKQYKLGLLFARRTKKKRVRVICESCAQPEFLPMVLIPFQSTDLMAGMKAAFENGVFNN